MKVARKLDSQRTALCPDLMATLAELRARRAFEPRSYVRAKLALLEKYLADSGLKACVVGVSGGIDSAVVLGLLMKAKRNPGSPLQRVVAVLMPMFVPAGATNQKEALSHGREVVNAFQAEGAIVDLSRSHAEMKRTVDGALEVPGGPWASGQLVSYLRTPALFYAASLLAQEGAPALVVGTTNRDEGGYIGYFGKAADAMVDLQLISDLHKSEVRAVAETLGVPKSVLDAIPHGDVYDGRSDEELIGVPYDFLELHTLWLTSNEDDRERFRKRWGPAAKEEFERLAARVEKLHDECAHKYLGGSPAVHLDVYERAVPGGWREENVSPVHKPDRAKFVNEIDFSPELITKLVNRPAPLSRRQRLLDFQDSAWLVDSLLAKEECALIRAELADKRWVPVGRNGYLSDFDPERDRVGSFRASIYSERLAAMLWERLRAVMNVVRVMEHSTPTDGHDSPAWRAVGVNPLLRLIRYEPQGALIPHYDAPFHYHAGKRTLMSVVIYLTGGNEGATRLLLDPARHLPFSERDFSDHRDPALPRDVLVRIPPREGAALVLDHRVLHDSEELPPGSEGKLILRTDVVFERCGLRAGTRLNRSKPLGMPERRKLSQKAGTPWHERTDRFAKKLLLDPYYGSASRYLLSDEEATRAGFFDDGLLPRADVSHERDTRWFCTPIEKITRRLKERQASGAVPVGGYTVLLTTGAFSPVHQGHLHMMELARMELEARGACVLGGYLSPSHDDYVGPKCKNNSLPATHRLRLCEEAVLESDWLMADGWEALHLDRAVNFTDVIARLQAYLSAHVRSARPLHVVYVFGSDNAGFARAFLERGQGVCVARAGYEDAFRSVSSDPRVQGNSRILFTKDRVAEISSSAVRAGDETPLHDSVRRTFRFWKKQKAHPDPVRGGLYYLRDEGDWVMAPWVTGERSLEATLRPAWNEFREGLSEALARELKAAVPPDPAIEIDLRVLKLEEQRKLAARLTRGEKTISLDACVRGDYNLGLSRLFPLSGGRSLPTIVARPGWPPLEAQVAKIPPGDYVLLDDDIATGSTIERVLELLPKSISIKRVIPLVHVWGGSDTVARELAQKTRHLDLVDSRDLLAGAREGGLVVSLPDGSVARAPYMFPYVSLPDRACTPLSRERETSYRLWQLNEAFYLKVSPALTLAETDPNFQRAMLYLGFKPSDTMLAICRWHLLRLERKGLGQRL